MITPLEPTYAHPGHGMSDPTPKPPKPRILPAGWNADRTLFVQEIISESGYYRSQRVYRVEPPGAGPFEGGVYTPLPEWTITCKPEFVKLPEPQWPTVIGFGPNYLVLSDTEIVPFGSMATEQLPMDWEHQMKLTKAANGQLVSPGY
jgi:hypothetical protein